MSKKNKQIKNKNKHAIHMLMCVLAVAGFYTIWSLGTIEAALASALTPDSVELEIN